MQMFDSNRGSAHSSKLEEQAKAKGDISYSWWANPEKPANSDIVPKKLSEGEAAQMQQGSERAGSQQTASAWNSAGTFEERSVTDWAKQHLEQKVIGTSSGAASITKCTGISGDAHIWFIRGKKRHGFEFDIDLAWQFSSSIEEGEEPITGTIKLPNASPDDLDDDLHMEVKLDKPGNAADSAALQAAKGLKQPLVEVLTQFYEELKTK